MSIYFIGKIVPTKYMPKISAVGLFCPDKFENNQTRTCITFFRTSKLTEVYFNEQLNQGRQLYTQSVNQNCALDLADHRCLLFDVFEILHQSKSLSYLVTLLSSMWLLDTRHLL